MTIVYLIELLAKYCSQLVANYRLETSEVNHTAKKAPQVVKYFLPPKNPKPGSSNVPDLPVVIVRPTEGEDNDGGSTAKVMILISTHSHDDDGVVDAVNLLQHVRDGLLRDRYLVDERGNKKFRAELPFKWSVYEEQSRPAWYASLLVNFEIAQSEEEIIYD